MYLRPSKGKQILSFVFFFVLRAAAYELVLAAA